MTSEGAPLTVAGVAGRLGVAASTLRTWDRRYGLGPSAHVAGSHRKYTPEDVARLERMRALTLQGVAPADAARAAVAYDPAAPDEGPLPEPSMPERPSGRLLVDALSVAAAAVEPDPGRVLRMLDQEVEKTGVVRAWSTVVSGALEMLDQREKIDLPGIEPESVLRVAFLTAVRNAVERASSGGERAGGPRTAATATQVLLCSEESRRLEAHVVGGGLAEAGIHARVLGAAEITDAAPVLAAIGGLGPGVLVMLGHPPGGEDLVRAASERGDLVGYLLGEGVPDLWLPRVHRVRTLGAAVEEIAAAARTRP